MTQGGRLSAKLFSIVVVTVIHEWMRLMYKTIDDAEGHLAKLIQGLFAVFYVDDSYIASCNAEFLQEALDILVEMFKHVGFATNTKKTQVMVCMPGRIRVQLPTDSYKHMCKGVAAGEKSRRAMVCHVCNKSLQARSLRLHPSSTHNIHQQVVVAEVLLEKQTGIRYRADPGGTKEPIQCPFPGCPGMLSSPYMLRHHFWDLYPKDAVEIPRERTFSWCEHCTMQSNPRYLQHIHTQVCKLGAEQQTQQDLAITAALALCKLFYIKGELLKKVDLFRYLERILAQDNDDVGAVRNQIKIARRIWARVRQILMADNNPQKVSAKFYKEVVQSVLLCGSKTWNLLTTAPA
jgi:hypothetical protein